MFNLIICDSWTASCKLYSHQFMTSVASCYLYPFFVIYRVFVATFGSHQGENQMLHVVFVISLTRITSRIYKCRRFQRLVRNQFLIYGLLGPQTKRNLIGTNSSDIWMSRNESLHSTIFFYLIICLPMVDFLNYFFGGEKRKDNFHNW